MRGPRSWPAFTALALLAGALTAGEARAEDNPACAQYEEPLAYNACLAKLGPQARAVRGGPAPPARSLTPEVRRRRAHGGRVHLEIPVDQSLW